MKNFGWLVFLIIIAANVIGPILQKRNQKARKQRQQGLDRLGSPTQRSAASRPPSSPGSSRLEQLAARRQAQLEELRGRSEQRRSAVSTSQARIGPASSATPATRPSAFRAPAPQPKRPVTRPAPARPSVTRKTRPQPVPRRTVSKKPAAQPVERKRLVDLHAKPAASARPKAASRPFLSLDARTITPQLLRRLVVLKEIFDAPIALRNRDIWDRPG